MLLPVLLLLSVLRCFAAAPQWRDVTGDAGARGAVQRLLLRCRECATPVPKVFAVGELGEEYGEYSGQYRPRCVELWRCANDTGCCAEADESCAPADVEVVHLPLIVGLPGQPSRTLLVPFLNHTRCACQTTTDDFDER